jgi:hypothetical protein
MIAVFKIIPNIKNHKIMLNKTISQIKNNKIINQILFKMENNKIYIKIISKYNQLLFQPKAVKVKMQDKMMTIKYVLKIYYVQLKYFKIKEIALIKVVKKQNIQKAKYPNGYQDVNHD